MCEWLAECVRREGVGDRFLLYCFNCVYTVHTTVHVYVHIYMHVYCIHPHYPPPPPPPTHTHSQILAIRDQFSQLQDEYTQVGAECAALRTMVEERDTFIKTIKTEIYRKEYKNDTAKVDLHNQLLQKDAIIKKLEVRLVCVKSDW